MHLYLGTPQGFYKCLNAAIVSLLIDTGPVPPVSSHLAILDGRKVAGVTGTNGFKQTVSLVKTWPCLPAQKGKLAGCTFHTPSLHFTLTEPVSRKPEEHLRIPTKERL